MITRSSSQRSFNLGHFHASGDIWMDYNYLFTGLIENGTLGLYYTDEDKKSKDIFIINTTEQNSILYLHAHFYIKFFIELNIQKVRQAWKAPKQINPILQQYSEPQVSEELVRYFVSHDKFKNRIQQHGWTNNYLFPAHDIPPSSSHHHNTFQHLAHTVCRSLNKYYILTET